MDNTVFSHYSVLKSESIDALQIRPDGIYVDCTAGGGGHSFEIASRLTTGRLFAFDRDEAAIKAASERLSPFSDRVTMVKSNFTEAATILRSYGISGIDGALIDLGVSSYQLDTAERGFSYMQDAPLDMRMDREQALTAYDVVNTYSENELKKILFTYGEEKFAPKIAASIVRQREAKPIESTLELAELIKNAMPAKAKVGGHHPAKRSFQAIRIEVNGELSAIEPTLRDLVSLLNPMGRLAVITFHSLEDRITKQTFASLCGACTCPPDFPICVCGKTSIVRLPFKSVAPGEQELLENPRSRSARLRVAEKI